MSISSIVSQSIPKALFASIVLLIGLSSCEENGVPKKQIRDMEDYIASNNLTVTEQTDQGLYFIRISDGTGNSLNVGDNVSVNYKGNLLNGDVFDSGTFTFTLGVGQVVRGFDLGILRMSIGEKAILIFPSTLGYGNAARGSIPKNAPLVFEIEVVEVQ